MNRQRTRNAVWSWEVIGAICCFAGGMSAALLGSVLTASTWILGAVAHPLVRGLGTALLILTIPLLILAGYCMDWAEEEPKDTRLQGSQSGERGSVSAYQALIVGIFLTVVLIAPLEVHAQQTIFNVPTTDVLEKGIGALADDLTVEVRVKKTENKHCGSGTQTFYHRSCTQDRTSDPRATFKENSLGSFLFRRTVFYRLRH